MVTKLISIRASRNEGLKRLVDFLPKATETYTEHSAFDAGPSGQNAVSMLSPYLNLRLLTEDEVLRRVLSHYKIEDVQRFIESLCRRTYWKGWLEMHPGAWAQYQACLDAFFCDIQAEPALRKKWESASRGKTGIACFDAWANELIFTGHLHHQARMWFATIWIYTLELPWELGADFFIRNLLDGDPASNTLSWRSIAGLQSQASYQPQLQNIVRFTNGRFPVPGDLIAWAGPKGIPAVDERQALPEKEWMQLGLKTGLLIHDDDLSPDVLINSGLQPEATAFFSTKDALSPLGVAPHVSAFARSGLASTVARLAESLGPVSPLTSAADIAAWAQDHKLEQIVTPYAPVGPNADLLRKLSQIPGAPPLRRIMRFYDRSAWPHASASFARFKARIPKLIQQLDNDPSAI